MANRIRRFGSNQHGFLLENHGCLSVNIWASERLILRSSKLSFLYSVNEETVISQQHPNSSRANYPIFMFNCLNVVENTLYHMDAVENIIPKLPGREAGREGSRGQTPESAPLVELDPTGVGEQDLAEAILCWGWNHPKLLSILVSCRFFSLCYLGRRGGGRRGGRRGRWGRGASWVFFQCIRRILYRAATCAGRLDFAPLHLPSSVCGSTFIDT